MKGNRVNEGQKAVADGQDQDRVPADGRRSRRAVLAGLIGAPVTAVGEGAAARKGSRTRKPAPGPTKPNIVIIQLDDMRTADWRVMRRTRKMLKGATWFPNYTIGFPYCAASRASLLTGAYAHNHGVVMPGNLECWAAWTDQAFDKVAIGSVLRREGYQTASIGKYLNGYQVAYPAPDGWSRWVAVEKGAHVAPVMRVDGEVVTTDRKVYGLRVFGDYASEFIASTPVEDPLLLLFSPVEPHLPDDPERKYRGRYDTVPLERPASFNEADVSDKPAYIASTPQLTVPQIAALERSNRARMEMMLSVDEIVSGLLRDLKRAGRWDNTCVFVVSDNGYMLGEHRLTGKHAPYTPSAVVPMLAWGPGFTAGTDMRLVSNVDIAPTCAELAGTEMPRADGFSLLGTRWRQYVPMYRYPDPDLGGGGRGVRSRDLLYFELETHQREYYDLRIDPFELQNLLYPGQVGEVYPSGLPGSAYLRSLTAMFGSCVGKRCSQVAP